MSSRVVTFRLLSRDNIGARPWCDLKLRNEYILVSTSRLRSFTASSPTATFFNAPRFTRMYHLTIILQH